MATRRAVSHADLVRACGVGRGEVVSAGFVSLGYGPEEEPKVYGGSVGLGVAARDGAQVPRKLYCARLRLGVMFATRKELVEGLDDVREASWGMTPESPWRDVMPVYAPLHPAGGPTAADYVTE